jgi:hypothetical protein
MSDYHGMMALVGIESCICVPSEFDGERVDSVHPPRSSKALTGPSLPEARSEPMRPSRFMILLLIYLELGTRNLTAGKVTVSGN